MVDKIYLALGFNILANVSRPLSPRMHQPLFLQSQMQFFGSSMLPSMIRCFHVSAVASITAVKNE
jgi:hypothetical protein